MHASFTTTIDEYDDQVIVGRESARCAVLVAGIHPPSRNQVTSFGVRMTPPRDGWLTGAYEQSRSWLVSAVGLTNAVFSGAWLGILRSDHLDEIDDRYHGTSAFARSQHNLCGLFYWERQCIERFPATGRILVTAAGGGREMLALARMDYTLDGCECNPLLAAVANRLLTSLGCSVTVVARGAFAAPRSPYDAAILGWGSYALMRGRSNRIRFLKSLASVIQPGAPVMLSFPTRAEGARGLKVTWALATALRRLSRREPIELGDNLHRFSIHHFTRAELESEIRDAGYELLLYNETDYGHAVCCPI